MGRDNVDTVDDETKLTNRHGCSVYWTDTVKKIDKADPKNCTRQSF